jgi:hypothetical protein
VRPVQYLLRLGRAARALGAVPRAASPLTRSGAVTSSGSTGSRIASRSSLPRALPWRASVGGARRSRRPAACVACRPPTAPSARYRRPEPASGGSHRAPGVRRSSSIACSSAVATRSPTRDSSYPITSPQASRSVSGGSIPDAVISSPNRCRATGFSTSQVRSSLSVAAERQRGTGGTQPPQQRLYLRSDPHQHGSLRPGGQVRPSPSARRSSTNDERERRSIGS